MSNTSQFTESGGSYVTSQHNIAAQDLLKHYSEHHGFIRKRGKRERVFERFRFAKPFISNLLRWRQRFVVISGGCVYIYNNENATRPIQCIPLEGYNRMYLMSSEQSEWTFRLESVSTQAKIHYFSCIDDKDRKEWMKKIRNAMSVANGKEIERPPIDESKLYDYLVKPVFTKEETSLEDDENSSCNSETGSNVSDYWEIKEVEPNLPKTKPNIPLPDIPQESEAKGNKTKKSEDDDVHDYINAPKKSKTLPPPLKQKKAAEKAATPSKSASLPQNSKSKNVQAQIKTIPSENEYLFNSSDRDKALTNLRDKPKGTFLVRLSRNQHGKVLAVQTEDDIKEYRLFEKNNSVTLNNKDYFKSVEDLISNYYEKNLPNRNMSLARAFSQTDLRF